MPPRAARPSNAALARELRELAARLDLDGTLHSPRAYRRAADVVERAPRPIAEIRAREGAAGLEALPGIGPHIARTLCERLDTGSIARLERLRRKTPVDVMGLLAIDGIGPKRLRTLWKELEVADVKDLQRAVHEGRVRDVAGFGRRSEARLRQALRLQETGRRRVPRREALPVAERLRRAIQSAPAVHRCEIAGSLRRGEEAVGDIDLVATSNDDTAAARALLARPEVAAVYSRGPRRVSVALESGIDVDLRVVPPECLGSALLYFTGSRAHTVALRRLALAQGLRLNEYGLFRGRKCIAAATEEAIYEALSLPYLPPEARVGGSEIRDALRERRRER